VVGIVAGTSYSWRGPMTRADLVLGIKIVAPSATIPTPIASDQTIVPTFDALEYWCDISTKTCPPAAGFQQR
jgi:hypothetical protein